MVLKIVGDKLMYLWNDSFVMLRVLGYGLLRIFLNLLWK